MHALDTFSTWQLIGVAATLGWASGVRLYTVLFMVGGLGCLDWIQLPNVWPAIRGIVGRIVALFGPVAPDRGSRQ